MSRFSFLACLAALIACAVPASSSAASTRIVSLVPSLTEDLFAIGAGAHVVAVSQFTDYPAAAAKLPAVASFQSVDAERIVRLHPDLVVGISAQGALVADLRRAGLRVELVRDDSFDDLFATLLRLGALSGHPHEATALARSLQATTARLVRSVPPGPRPRTFVVLGTAPIYTVGDGSYIAHLISLAGGVNASGLTQAYARYSAEALLGRQPDVIVADTYSGVRAVLDEPPWNALHAVRDGRLYVLQDPAILERPGPRYNIGLAWLIARLHPRGTRP
ncbi:MAG: ABC transporter substrate-binding protein [Candidatus Eremiobacteraeota bacterium]|nr:ABC transporter substrate-binding protein [Candidatus Eremiobacteraeota bacterium]